MLKKRGDIIKSLPIQPYVAVAAISLVCLGLSFLVFQEPMILGLIIFSAVGVYCLLNYFTTTILSLVVFRSSLDIFSSQGIPALFAIGMIAIMILYAACKILLGESLQLDRFWLFLIAWVAVTSIWVVLLPIGGLGLGGAYFSEALREWVRLFSFAIAYLMVLQLKGRVHPVQFINALFLSLIVPLLMATVQIILPESALPDFLSLAESYSELSSASRINGTFGHPNAFVTFLVFFTGLAYWKVGYSRQRWPWLLLLGILFFFIVSTKALVGLVMAVVLIFSINIQKLNPKRMLGAFLLAVVLIALFASSEFGQERLASLYDTPLLNPEIDVSRAIIMRNYTFNSFLWRVTQWNSMIEAWKDYPILGFGLSTVRHVAVFENAAHNDYLRALTEGGIVGLAVFLTFLGGNMLRSIRILFTLPKDSPQHGLCVVVCSTLLAMMVGMLTDNVMSHTTLFFYFLSVSSLLTWDWGKPTNGEINLVRE